MNRVHDPSELAALFEQDRETHIYGLADLEEPYWSSSQWYRVGDAAVGFVSDGSGWITGYAMSESAPVDTLDLLADSQSRFPPGTWITGPSSMSTRLSDVRVLRSVGPHYRMILDNSVSAPLAAEAVDIGEEHLDLVQDLAASDEGSAFLLQSMLRDNPFVGIFEEDLLVAMAGTHVASKRYGVAAIGGVLTRPSHRGRGLGYRVVAAICDRLIGEYETIGLNVSAANQSAIAIYDRLGFSRAFDYEEVELL